MNKVTWKIKGLYNADAQLVYNEIGTNTITPEEIVEKARDPSSELHKCFEWDDKKAAEKYRIQQARSIMCNLVFVSDSKKEDLRVFYNLTFEKAEYHPTTLIMQNPDEYIALLCKAKGELLAFRKKYSMLKELGDVFRAIDKALEIED